MATTNGLSKIFTLKVISKILLFLLWLTVPINVIFTSELLVIVSYLTSVLATALYIRFLK